MRVSTEGVARGGWVSATLALVRASATATRARCAFVLWRDRERARALSQNPLLKHVPVPRTVCSTGTVIGNWQVLHTHDTQYRHNPITEISHG